MIVPAKIKDSLLIQNVMMLLCETVIRAWPIHRQHSPSGPIVGQSEPSADDENRWPVSADDVTHWIHLAMGSIGHPCRTIQGPTRYLPLMTVQALGMYLSVRRPGQQPMQYCSSFEGVSVFDQAVLLPCWTNNHCPRPGLNVVIKHYWPSFPPPL